MTGDEYCTEFEHRVWFELYRHMWRDSRQVTIKSATSK